MPRSQTSNRRRSTIKKVKMKPKKQQCPKSQRFQHSALDYDEKASQFTNYARLGLMADANAIGAVKDRITGFKPRVKVPDVAVAAAPLAADGAHPLELEVPDKLKVNRKVPLGERQVLLKLQARHGADYAAMARDMRLNALQHTAAHLRRRFEKMREDDVEDEVAEGAVPHRLEPKMTKHPNPAFRKKSTNFY